MAIEIGPFEDVFPIENGDFPASYVSLPKGTHQCSNKIGPPTNKIQNTFAHNFRGMVHVRISVNSKLMESLIYVFFSAWLNMIHPLKFDDCIT